MAGKKETPRQKMIGMMYLVLTALLALNVSADVLNSFTRVNEGIMETNRIFSQKVEGMYAQFEKAMANNPEKTRAAYEKAQKVKARVKQMVDYIEDVKARLIAATEGVSVEEARKMSGSDLKKRDNYDIPTHFMVGQDQAKGTGGEAHKLKLEIEKFKKDMLGFVSEKSRDNVKIGLNTSDIVSSLDKKTVHTWEIGTFYHTIQIACVTILNKLILEVKNAEADVLAQIYADVSAEDFKFNKISAKVVPKSNFIIVGDKYEAEIFVAAYDTISTPEVIIGADVDTVNMRVLGTPKTLDGYKGVVKYEAVGSSPGIQKFGGLVNVPLPTGGKRSFPFKGEYIVGAPTATVSADKMNVFYIGVDNPVSISVPGIPNDKVRPSITNGRLTPTGSGKYNVRVDGGTETTINVGADMGGTIRNMGSVKFRVKQVPDPVPVLAGMPSGTIDRNALIASPYVRANLEGFDFDLKFDVVSYSFTIKVGQDLVTEQANGSKLTESMINKITKAPKGTKLYIEDIKVQAPGLPPRMLKSSISLKIS